ncbi:MAG: hypothetical protein SVM80_03310 [Halobacteriota archaeon]|nr:hypothetical protein [Halobacteriota archaeon]
MLTTMVSSATSSSIQSLLPLEIGGVLTTVSLILFLSLTELFSDSEWWDRWISSTLRMSTNPFLLVFLGIVIFKVLTVL